MGHAPITWALVVIMVALPHGTATDSAEPGPAGPALVEADGTGAAQTGDMARVEQAFGDLQSGYGGTAGRPGRPALAAKALADAGKWDAAKGVLTWVAEKSSDEGYVALARLRLAGVLMEQKAYDAAMAQLSGSMPAEFAGSWQIARATCWHCWAKSGGDRRVPPCLPGLW